MGGEKKESRERIRTRTRTKVGTRTSSFGVSRREGHDSSAFYGRRLLRDAGGTEPAPSSSQPCAENAVPARYLDTVICGSSEKMSELPDSSVHLAVTSPPYNVGKEYDADLTLVEYRRLLQAVFAELFRVLVDGGRACINVANLGRKPYIPLHSFVIQDMQSAGFLMRGEVIWNKGPSAGSSTAWGSWQSASNPSLRDVHEYILLFSKGSFSRRIDTGVAEGNGKKRDTIGRDEFLAFTRSVWDFPAESARRLGHPAPFPVELPYRCIQLYSFAGDVVLDPFCGVGSTCVAAVKSGRHFVGYDVNQSYVDAAWKRIREEGGEGEKSKLHKADID